VQLRQAPIRAIQPTGEEVEIAQVVTPPPPAELQVATATEPVLPPMESNLPLIGLFGLMSQIGAFAGGAFAKRL
jgi:hypothetical protein